MKLCSRVLAVLALAAIIWAKTGDIVRNENLVAEGIPKILSGRLEPSFPFGPCAHNQATVPVLTGN
jgi:hypothetical protein